MEARRKIVRIGIVGDVGSGKTSLIGCFLSENQRDCEKNKVVSSFHENYTPTVGVEAKFFNWHGFLDVYDIQFWDCSGDRKFSIISEGVYLHFDACVIVYDCTGSHKEIHKSVMYWKNKIQKKTKTIGKTEICTMLVGTKNDLETSSENWNQILSDFDIRYHSRTSSKTSEGVSQTFSTIISETVNEIEQKLQETKEKCISIDCVNK